MFSGRVEMPERLLDEKSVTDEGIVTNPITEPVVQ
jgi:hypothetical protein